MTINPFWLANSFLENSFLENHRITPSHLQRLMYLACSELAKQREGEVITESFLAYRNGAGLESIRYYYESLGNEPIDQYMQGYNNQTLSYAYLGRDALTGKIAQDIWDRTRHMSYVEVCETNRAPGGAWDHCWQNKKNIISYQIMKNDTSYKALLGMGYPKLRLV